MCLKFTFAFLGGSFSYFESFSSILAEEDRINTETTQADLQAILRGVEITIVIIVIIFLGKAVSQPTVSH